MKSLPLLSVCLFMLVLVSVLPGCSRSSARVYVKVSGKVVDAQGKPVPAINIRFFPTENVDSFKVGHSTGSSEPRVVSLDYPLAISKKDGTFTLTMSGGDIEGARPGKYCVMLTGSKEQNKKIPLKYQNPDSPLDVTIPNKDVSDLVLKIE
ncbi:MAG: hypothetical protein L0Y72_07605 [Gemmataceae bacterium]|nr:hypothetical protein [Gemmataceae bacterium]MCI0738894.1 hypothetical protein [Gemmataceae bacterium]